MTTLAFIGLGNMGSGMAANQAKAGRQVLAFDLSPDAVARAVENGCEAASSAADAISRDDTILTMLPAGHVCGLYGRSLANAKAGPVNRLFCD